MMCLNSQRLKARWSSGCSRERGIFIDNLLVRIHFIIEMISWTGLAPWEFELPFPGSLTSTFLRDALSCSGAASAINLTSQQVFYKSFCKNQLPHKSVNLFFILVMNLCGNWLLQKDFWNTFSGIKASNVDGAAAQSEKTAQAVRTYLRLRP